MSRPLSALQRARVMHMATKWYTCGIVRNSPSDFIKTLTAVVALARPGDTRDLDTSGLKAFQDSLFKLLDDASASDDFESRLGWLDLD